MNIGPLISGRIIKRYKRFLADIVLEDGHTVTAHCPNTGSMTGCWKPGAPAQLSKSNNPKRKLKFTLERVDMGCGWIGVNTARVNHIVKEGLVTGMIPELRGYQSIQSEPRYEARGFPPSRFDFLLTQHKDKKRHNNAYVEVKNTTLLIGDQMQFPDAITERGRKHLQLLAHAKRSGYRAVIIFAINRPEGRVFTPAREIDHAYANTLEKVVSQGVEAIAVRLRHTEAGIEVAGSAAYQT